MGGRRGSPAPAPGETARAEHPTFGPSLRHARAAGVSRQARHVALPGHRGADVQRLFSPYGVARYLYPNELNAHEALSIRWLPQHRGAITSSFTMVLAVHARGRHKKTSCASPRDHRLRVCLVVKYFEYKMKFGAHELPGRRMPTAGRRDHRQRVPGGRSSLRSLLVMTGLNGVHVLGGIRGLDVESGRARRPVRPRLLHAGRDWALLHLVDLV